MRAHAVPGDLDTTFGSGTGVVISGLQRSSHSEYATAVLQQPDGKLVIASSSTHGTDSDIVLVRYNPDGSLDSSFSEDGKAAAGFSPPDGFAHALIQQMDGKLVVAGSFGSNDNNNFDFAIARFNPDGSLDTAFGASGKVTTDMGGYDEVQSVIQQQDGKLVVAGYTDDFSNRMFAMARYNPDGSPDTSFGTGGNLTTFLNFGTANAVIQQLDGKLVAVGSSSIDSHEIDTLVRYNTDGSLDTGFGTNGILTTLIGTSSAARAITLQPDGKLVVASTSYGGSNQNFALSRYNTNGSLDTSFDGDGTLTTDIGNADNFTSALIRQTNGKFTLAGYTDNNGRYNIALVRYNNDGSLDTAFDGDGKLVLPIGNFDDYAYAITQQTDGKLVVAGESSSGSNYDIALVRLAENGASDVTFDNDGKLFTTITTASMDIANALVQQADGKLVAAGSSSNGHRNDFALVRYLADGTRDTGFGNGGVVITAVGNQTAIAYALLQQADGKLVAAGESNNGSNIDITLVRYNTDGTLDSGFGSNGIITTDLNASHDYAYSVIQQPDGKLLAGGYYSKSAQARFALVRYNTDGSLDTSFGTGGKVITAIGGGNDVGRSLIQQSDGKLVMAGYSNASGIDIALARYNTDGSLDTGFSGDGKLVKSISTSGDYAYAVIQQADGKLVVAGGSYASSQDRFLLLRYNTNGELDTTFDGDGIVTTSVGSQSGTAYALIQQADGKLVAAGDTVGANTNYYSRFGLARYNTDGSLDNTFGNNGLLTTAIDNSHSDAYSLLQQSDGKITAAGYGDFISNTRKFVLVRYESGLPYTDFDGDGTIDIIDTDDDNDDVPDSTDAFPHNATESVDTDGDGTGNHADSDDDNDGVPDFIDSAPLNPAIGEMPLPLNGAYNGSVISDRTQGN